MSLYPSILRLLAEEEERKKKTTLNALGNLYNPQYGRRSLLTTPTVEKRKVFISYHHGNEEEVKVFVDTWATKEKLFIPKGLGLRNYNDFINSDNPEYVMSQIREKFLEDSTVTIVLMGSCTHSRRYVDWEIKASLRQGLYSDPNGLIGIVLPSRGTTADLPPRFEANWTSGHKDCYARYWTAPSSAEQLRGWIEDAFEARTSRAKLIKNSSDMMKYNATCNFCNITH